METVDDVVNTIKCCDHVTLIITTSPVPSMPSTQLISDLLSSLPSCLKGCDLVLTFDGCKPCGNANDLTGRAKRGEIPQYQANLYPAYILNVKDLFGNELQSLDRVGWGEETVSVLHQQDRSVTFIEHTKHLGFAYSVKAALKYVSRSFVMILQHDWHFESQIPGSDLLRIMTDEALVNYVTFTSRSFSCYEQKEGQSHHRFRAVSAATRALRKDKPLAGSLTCFFHFLDRPHLVRTQTYRKLLDGRSEMTRLPFKFRRGDFIEDTLGGMYSYGIKTASSDEDALKVWSQLGAWIFTPENGERVVKHANGRVILVRDDEDAKITRFIENNRLASTTAQVRC